MKSELISPEILLAEIIKRYEQEKGRYVKLLNAEGWLIVPPDQVRVLKKTLTSRGAQ